VFGRIGKACQREYATAFRDLITMFIKIGLGGLEDIDVVRLYSVLV